MLLVLGLPAHPVRATAVAGVAAAAVAVVKVAIAAAACADRSEFAPVVAE